MILRLQNYLNAKSSHLLSKISIPLKKSDDFLLYMKDENFKGNLLKHQRVISLFFITFSKNFYEGE